jgi:hypothetical protein
MRSRTDWLADVFHGWVDLQLMVEESEMSYLVSVSILASYATYLAWLIGVRVVDSLPW